MLRNAAKTSYFKVKPEEGQNPYIGFMSFQHFRDEEMYSDMVVLPERNYTETEHFECYPVPDYVEENGRSEGYYPDTSIVYIRILWKEFEPERGKYNYAFIENLLKKAKEKGQSLIFRLMAHSTRACDDVPEWLKALIPCPERPDGMRVKDSPTDPLFLELFTEAVKKFAERFDEDPTFDTIDISLPGAWGEGHNLHLYSEESLEKLVSVYTGAFRNTRLIGQIARPELIEKADKDAAMSIGWRGDGLGEPGHLYELYPDRVERLADRWKIAPVSFESYWWLGEWMRKGWDIDEIISLTLKWHISSFNAKSLPIPMEWKDKIDYWVGKMGYHFALEYFKCPETAEVGDEMELKIGIDNTGVAPLYRKMPLMLRFTCGEESFTVDSGVDVTKWLPGKNVEKMIIPVPAAAKKGTYTIEAGIFDAENPVIYFATDARRNGSFYQVGEITIC